MIGSDHVRALVHHATVGVETLRGTESEVSISRDDVFAKMIELDRV